MKIAFDTNVILDAISNRECVEHAQALYNASVQGRIHGVITTKAVLDINYILRKDITTEGARSVIMMLLKSFSVVPVNCEDCVAAAYSPINDYEYAVFVSCAKRERVDYIVTLDDKLLNEPSDVPILTPEEILQILKETP